MRKQNEVLEEIDHVPGFSDEEVAEMVADAERGDGLLEEMPLNGPAAVLVKVHPEARRQILQLCDERGLSIEDAMVEVLNAQFAA